MRDNRRNKYNDYSTDELENVIYQYVRGQQNRDIWRLWLIEQMTYKQIADALYIGEKTVARCINDYDQRVFLHLD